MKRPRRRLQLERSGPWIAVAGLLVNLWLSISSTLYAPWWGLVVIFGLLVPQVVLLARWAKDRPAQTPWIPGVGALVWALVVVLGAVWWGWSFD